MKSVNNAVLAIALLTASAVAGQQVTQPQTQSPATKQADCTQTTNPLENKHIQVRPPTAVRRRLYKMLGSLSNKTGVSVNPNDIDLGKIAKKASKPCPAPPAAPANQ